MIKKIIKSFDFLKKNRKGFSLVEMLVSISVFAIIMSIVSAFFISSLKTQKIVFMRQELLSETSYAMEYISRSIRMATKDIDGDCIGVNENYQLMDPFNIKYGEEIVTVGKGIIFKDYTGNCKRFYYTEGGQLMEDRKAPGGSWGASKLISGEINILSVLFTLKGELQTDNVQPRVSFIIKAVEENAIFGTFSRALKIQTSVSQRNIDIIR